MALQIYFSIISIAVLALCTSADYCKISFCFTFHPNYELGAKVRVLNCSLQPRLWPQYQCFLSFQNLIATANVAASAAFVRNFLQYQGF